MKKLILSVTALAACSVGAYAQGNVSFQNESGINGLVDINSGGTLANATQFTVALYYADVAGAATTASLGTDTYGQLTYSQFVGDQAALGLMLGGTAQFDPVYAANNQINGVFNGGAVTTTVPGLVNDDIVLAAWTGNSTTLSAAEAAGAYVGIIGFANPLGAGGQNPNIPILSGWNGLTPTPASSAFEGGNYPDLVMSQTTTVVPEPSTFAMAGVGLASMLIFRRRNK